MLSDQLFMSTVLFMMFMASLAMTYYLSHSQSKLRVLDRPNSRSLHTRPTPRTGGLAIYAALLSGILYNYFIYGQTSFLTWYGLSATVLAIVAFVDDLYDLSVSVRLIAQVVIAGYIVSKGMVLCAISPPGVQWTLADWLSIVTTVIYIIWTINWYNFMDGMDGFAGGMSVIGFGAYAVLAYVRDDSLLLFMSLSLVVSTAGFLYYNLPPAKIFMGDVGSYLLGFSVAVLSLYAHNEGVIPVWLSIIIFSPFIIDASLTLIKRIYRREKFWQPHQSHYFQILIRSGWGHTKTVLAGYALMLTVSLCAIFIADAGVSVQIIVSSFLLIAYMVIIFLIETRFARHLSLEETS